MIRGFLFVSLLLLQPLLARPAAAWWNADWPDRMKITADASPKGANITEPVGRTQILVRLHSGNFNFATAKEDGTDLRFVAGDDRTPLKFHIEKYDGLIDQVGLIWIDVPDLAPGTATSFYMYWGNKNATPGGDAKATYDPDQLLVYHFTDENGLPRDVTGYGNNALTPAKRDEGGMIGFGGRLDGRAPVRIPNAPSLAIAPGQALTWSLWARAEKSSLTSVLYSLRDGANALTIGLDQGVAYAQIETPSGTTRTPAGTGIQAESWHHIAVTASDHLTIYVDGVPAGTVAAALPQLSAVAALGGTLAAPAAPAAAPATPAAPGAPAAPAAGAPPAPAAPAPGAAPAAPDATAAPAAASAPPNFVGVIDELEISKVARPAGAFQVAVKSQGPAANLIAFDVAEESSVLGNGYIAIIVRSVTPDAWAVIGILGVMALISWWVMGGKAMYLGRVNKANAAFRAAFRESMTRAGRDGRAAFAPIETKRPRALAGSPLFRLYQIGTRELLERLDNGLTEPNGALAPQSLAAIRSALEAGLTRETQRLNRLMVLLTIAISGGPFLGLLGTVVGVMITFAAIAAAGDVNVNSIAPGIAAALLATVAGLAVAIPALFGYNYLLTRIRDVTADMNVFVDEIITRMGERFRGSRMQPGE
jgi:biopolymer transport protein ExbB